MEKVILIILIILLSFGLAFAKDDSLPRELTPKERREVCRDINKIIKQYQQLKGAHGFHNVKRGEVKCLGKDSRNILTKMEGMNEKEAMNFFSPKMKSDLKIAGYYKLYFEDLNGNRWVEDLR